MSAGLGDDMPSSRRWFRLLLQLYPDDFRDEMGHALVETYTARARAARAFGPFALARVWLRALVDSVWNGLGERMSPAVAWRRSRGWGRDAQLVLRRLVRAPVFTLAILGTLAVGLGAFAVVYTVVHQVLVAPLPYENPDDLYYVWRDYRAFFDLDRGWMAGTDVVELAKAGGAIEDAVALRSGSFTLTGDTDERPTEVEVMLTTPNLFDVLGVHPVLGRGFAPSDGGEGAGRVIVLTHPLWMRLGGEASSIGRELRLDGEPFTVIGVLPADFDFAMHSSLGAPSSAEAYIPFDYDLSATNPGSGAFASLIRAREGTPAPVVATAVEAVGRAVDERDFGGRGLKFYPVAMKPDLVARVRPALVVVGLAGLFLVLVLLVNLASLLLVRAVERENELAVSRALGANGMALMRATVLEGAVLGMAGGAAGAIAAIWATRAFVSLAPADLPRLGRIAVDWPIGLTVVGLGLVLGLLAASLPAVWATRARLASLLSASAVRGGGGHGRARRGMVVIQVALSLVLLSAGGLVVRSFGELLRSNPGFETAGVLTLRIPIADAQTVAEAEPRHEAIQRELARIPGVTTVGAASALPLAGGTNQTTIEVPGAPGNTGDREADHPLVDYVLVRPGYFEAMGMRLLEGRTLDPARPGGSREGIIDQQIARQFFPGGSPLGARIVVGGDSIEVIGVVQHARMYDVHADGRPQVYSRNEGQFGDASLSYAIRTTREPRSLASEVRSVVASVDPQLAVSDVRTMDDIVSASLSQQRVSAVLIAGFSLGALFLAAMGVFGVVSGSVTRRRHELALRLALGADHGRVLRHVLGEGAALVALGLLIGAPGVYFGGRVIRSILVGVSPWDPVTLVAVAIGLAGIALLACWLPARRVTGIEPARVLREG